MVRELALALACCVFVFQGAIATASLEGSKHPVISSFACIFMCAFAVVIVIVDSIEK